MKISSVLFWLGVAQADDIDMMTDDQFTIMTTPKTNITVGSSGHYVLEYYLKAKIPDHFHEENVLYEFHGNCYFMEVETPSRSNGEKAQGTRGFYCAQNYIHWLGVEGE